MEFSYTMKLDAANKEESLKIMTALTKFVKYGTPGGKAEKIEKIANAIEKKPSIIDTAIKHLT